MNKNKKIINGLLILAAVQLILLIVVNTFSFNSIKTRKADKVLLKGVTEKNITKVKIWDKIDGFTLTKEKDTWFIKDLNSKNGTFVNGTRIASERPFSLDDGYEIGFGAPESRLIFCLP